MKHAPQGTFVQKEKVVMSNIQNYVDSGDWERTLKKKWRGEIFLVTWNRTERSLGSFLFLIFHKNCSKVSQYLAHFRKEREKLGMKIGELKYPG